MSSAHLSVIPEFVEKIEVLNAMDHFDVGAREIVNRSSGSQVIFRGLKTSSGIQTANLKSIQGINVWALDEAEEFVNETEFDKIDLSIRNPNTKNLVILLMNPTTKEHWIWKRWFEGHTKYIEIDGFKVPVSTHPDITHIHTTYLDNIDNIPPDYLKQILKIKQENPEKYRHVILGGWLEKAEGVVFENWSEGEFDNYLPYGFGLDFGFAVDPDALIQVAIDSKRKKIYLKERLYQNGISSARLASILKSECGRSEIIADSAEPRLIGDLKSIVNINKADKPPGSIVSGIKIMQGFELIIDPGSHNLKREMNNYAWSDRKSETPIDDYNHLIVP
jgi:phage terminase large subunit